MSTDVANIAAQDDGQIIEPVGYDFGLSRREFVQVLGAGLIIAASVGPALGQARRGGGPRREAQPVNLDARVHLANDGTITVMTGKVECGQGARAQLTQAAAEELRVAPDAVQLVMADTSICPDDWITAGSRTTPTTVPAVRQACAAARDLLIALAASQWNASRDQIQVREGSVKHPRSDERVTYKDLANADTTGEVFSQSVPSDVRVTPVDRWQVLGTSLARPNRRDIVTGAHRFPSDITQPGMLYGRVLRSPTYRARLRSADVSDAKKMEGVVVVQDSGFVGVAAPTAHLAERAIKLIERRAQWESGPHPASRELFDHLRRTARRDREERFADAIASAHQTLRTQYDVAYIQHAPMEPRAAVAQWDGDALTVWTGSQNPFGVRRELAGAFHIPEERVRVIIPDFGGGFGGKHTGETAVEAARLARTAGKPVCVRWTREEEFTWASFRPAAAIDVTATLDSAGAITSWHFINMNSGGSAVESPYRIAQSHSQFVQAEAPLRHGSYRALAAAANTFARESFMDELAHATGKDPLPFRLAHLENPRLRAVLEEAARRFDWTSMRQRRQENVGVGLACGTDKGSFVAACAEVEIVEGKTIRVRRVCQAYECGAIINPDNLRAQVEGCIVMGLGPALREAIQFEDGKILNASFWKYEVPRLTDMPEIEIHLLNRTDLPSAGAGETPIIAVAPAVANAVFHATGQRLRAIPLRLG